MKKKKPKYGHAICTTDGYVLVSTVYASTKIIREGIAWLRKHSIPPDGDGNLYYMPGVGWVNPPKEKKK